MLIIVPTPIGNLKDITIRALDALKEVDYILCEDTRQTIKILNHYEIKKQLIAYHQFNEQQQLERILDDLKAGKQVALVSDAGTPGISDPGEILIQACIKEGIEVDALPGPCAAITAMTVSGMPTESFTFLGFLPKPPNERKQKLLQAMQSGIPTIFYESPHRIISTLELLQQIQPDAAIFLGRELTKRHQTFYRGTPEQVLQQLNSPRGEMVIIVHHKHKAHDDIDWMQLTPEEHVQWLQDSLALSRPEAIKIAAQQRGMKKQLLYKYITND